MRNLVKFAVMFAIAPSEEDIEQLGYEPTKEEFKSYYGIEEDAAEDGSYQRSKDFDAFGDLFWLLNPEEKNQLDPERKEEVTQEDVPATQPENVEAAEVLAEVKEVPFVVPANLAGKYQEAQEEVKLCEKTLKDENKELEKLKATNVKKVEKEQEKVTKAETKKDNAKPETVLAFNNAKSALNLATKEASKTEKAQTGKVNKAQVQLDKANAVLTKITDKIKAINLKDSLKTEKPPKAPKTEKTPTGLSRSQMIYLKWFEGMTVAEIVKENPDWSATHVRNSFYTAKDTPERVTKALEVQKKLGLPESIKDSKVTVKVTETTPATEEPAK